MQRNHIDADVDAVSEVRRHCAKFVRQVRDTRRPLVLTENAKPAAVLLDVREYERLVAKLELMDNVRAAEREMDAGLGIPHDEVMAYLRERFKGR